MNNGVHDLITLEELADDIDMLIWQKGITFFKVTEDFKNNEGRTYLVRGLNVGIEEEVVCCHDYDDVIFSNDFMLKAFLKKCVTSIKRTITHDYRKGELEFPDGIVLIEVEL